MTVYPRSAVLDKAACEKWYCWWSTDAPSRRKAIARAREHCRERGHRTFDLSGHRLRFEGDQ